MKGSFDSFDNIVESSNQEWKKDISKEISIIRQKVTYMGQKLLMKDRKIVIYRDKECQYLKSSQNNNIIKNNIF